MHTDLAEVTVRRATPADAAALARLRYQFRSEEAPPEEEAAAFIARCTDWMRTHLAAGSEWHCWLAEAPPRLIGAVWIQRIEKIPNPVRELEHHAYLTNFYIDGTLRGRGIGARLLEAALHWCRDESIDQVILWPTPGSRTLYTRFGFEFGEDIMRLKGNSKD